jgi:hypothetical protein
MPTREGAAAGVAARRWACVVLLATLRDALPTALASYCLPADPCWPHQVEWQALNASLGGQLASPLDRADLYANASALVYANWEHAEGHAHSPLALPALTVTAAVPADVATAVHFAAAHRLRLSVKSSGHTYTGRSTAAGSLLLFLHKLQSVAFHESFDDGCGGAEMPPAVTVEPGVTFGALYAAAAAQGFSVVGGGGPSVSAAGGFLQGGGHSPLGRALGSSVCCVFCFLHHVGRRVDLLVTLHFCLRARVCVRACVVLPPPSRESCLVLLLRVPLSAPHSHKRLVISVVLSRCRARRGQRAAYRRGASQRHSGGRDAVLIPGPVVGPPRGRRRHVRGRGGRHAPAARRPWDRGAQRWVPRR